MAGHALGNGLVFPFLSNVRSVCMETICPICGQDLEVHIDPKMAECGLAIMQRDYGNSYADDFTWMCPECDCKIDDHDDAMLAQCSRLLVLGDYSGGVYAG